MHRLRMAKFGSFDLPPRERPLIQRLMAKVRKDSTGCWNWAGADNGNGYGVIGIGRREEGTALVHRVAYEQIVGPIPAGLHIDHLCRNRLCVNPDHLEPVTKYENDRRRDEALRREREGAA